MAADDYAVAGGGALKLKGGKVQKSKKKKKSKNTSSNHERSLSALDGDSTKDGAKREKGKEVEKRREGSERGDTPQDPKNDASDDIDDTADFKTEAERRHEEIQRRKLLKMFEDGNARPELLKTHKERVEGLNTYLSKLSEHHDMPKIGPG